MRGTFYDKNILLQVDITLPWCLECGARDAGKQTRITKDDSDHLMLINRAPRSLHTAYPRPRLVRAELAKVGRRFSIWS
jgi:hypothetical protein